MNYIIVSFAHIAHHQEVNTDDNVFAGVCVQVYV